MGRKILYASDGRRPEEEAIAREKEKGSLSKQRGVQQNSKNKPRCESGIGIAGVADENNAEPGSEQQSGQYFRPAEILVVAYTARGRYRSEQ